VVSGNRADEPLYIPEIKRVQEAQLGSSEGGLTFIGDVKMAALGTRAFVALSNDYYLCPLPATQEVPPEEMERLLAPILEQRQTLLVGVFRPQEEREASTTTPEEEPELIAEGYEFSVAMEAATQEEKEEGVFLCSGKSDGW
jgi:transposase